MKGAVVNRKGELPAGHVLSHVLASAMDEVAGDLKAVFDVRREKTARTLAEEFILLYETSRPKAVSVFEAGVEVTFRFQQSPQSLLNLSSIFGPEPGRLFGARDLPGVPPIQRSKGSSS